MPMAAVTRDQLLSFLKRDTLDVPGLGTIHVRELGGAQMRAYKQKSEDLKAQDRDGLDAGLELMATLVAMSVIDENGKPLYTEEDIPLISSMSVELLQLISEKAMELSGQQEIVERLKKSHSTDSSSGSPTNSVDPSSK